MRYAIEQWMIIGMCAVSLTGCVSKWAYDEQVEKNEHLRYVKTEQDIERDGLHADVEALHRAYSQQSLRVTGLEGTVQQATTELKAIQSRLTSLNQEMVQQRGDLSKLSLQANETLQFLRAINEHQQATNVALMTMTTKLEAMKKPAPVKAARAAETGGKPKTEEKEGAPSNDKGAVERAMEQKLGKAMVAPPPKPQAVQSPGAEPAVAGGGPTTMPGGAGAPTLKSVAKPEGPIVQTEGVAVIPKAPTANSEVSAQKLSETPTPPSASISPSDSGANSPLLSTTPGELKPVAKQTWTEWAKEKIWGKKPVQTASQTPATAEKR